MGGDCQATLDGPPDHRRDVLEVRPLHVLALLLGVLRPLWANSVDDPAHAAAGDPPARGLQGRLISFSFICYQNARKKAFFD